MRNAIVTGASGFIGSWLVERLLEARVEVSALSVSGARGFAPRLRDAIRIIPYVPDRISDAAESLQKEYDVFYHAGWAGVAPENKDRLDLQLNNISTATEMVRLAKAIGCRRFVGIGTVAEYVYCDDLINYSQPPSPADLYGAAKVAAHFLAQSIAQSLSLPFNWAIVPSTFGERRTGNNIISYTIRTLLQKEMPTFTRLEQRWDFLYVADVVHALFLIGEKGLPGKTYGIGSGIWRPLKEYVEEIRDLIDPALPLGIGVRPYPSGRIASSCVDIADLVKDAGFQPRTTFPDGIRNTIEYFRRLA